MYSDVKQTTSSATAEIARVGGLTDNLKTECVQRLSPAQAQTLSLIKEFTTQPNLQIYMLLK